MNLLPEIHKRKGHEMSDMHADWQSILWWYSIETYYSTVVLPSHFWAQLYLVTSTFRKDVSTRVIFAGYMHHFGGSRAYKNVAENEWNTPSFDISYMYKILVLKIVSLNLRVIKSLKIVEFPSVLATLLGMWPAKIMRAHDPDKSNTA